MRDDSDDAGNDGRHAEDDDDSDDAVKLGLGKALSVDVGRLLRHYSGAVIGQVQVEPIVIYG